AHFDHVISLLGIDHLLERKPGNLSGGEAQRIAIGRALLCNPQLLLMDEPLASLDMQRREEILPYIEKLVDEFHLPLIYVSHAIHEIERLAQDIVSMENGRIVARRALQKESVRASAP
ncbi:MAG: ATP-binding cassette domain-containing protein, partial [Alphaproteobacteria bacterium]|nr:ATP-binding cassette domain-containing protein [Alphaproteobacteria bacterium]